MKKPQMFLSNKTPYTYLVFFKYTSLGGELLPKRTTLFLDAFCGSLTA